MDDDGKAPELTMQVSGPALAEMDELAFEGFLKLVQAALRRRRNLALCDRDGHLDGTGYLTPAGAPVPPGTCLRCWAIVDEAAWEEAIKAG